MRKVRLDALKGSALDFDVDPEDDLMKPGNSPPERAFQLVSCGFDLLMAIREHGLPVRGMRMRAKAQKWILQDSIFGGGATSKVFARLIPILMETLDGRLDDHDPEGVQPPTVPPEHHARLAAVVEDFYPATHKNTPDMCLEEFTVMEQKRPRDRVQQGEEEGTEYSRALMRGEDPDTDPELVAIQRRWARDYYINKATIGGLRVLLRHDWVKLEPNVVEITDPGARKVSQTRARSLAAWIDGTSSYRQYALVDWAGQRDNATSDAAPSASGPEPPK